MSSATLDLPVISGARTGDPFSWAELYDRYQPRLARFLVLTGASALAEDDSRLWAAAAESLKDEPIGIDPGVWLFRVARSLRDTEPGGVDLVNPLADLTDLDRDVIGLRVAGGLTETSVSEIIGRSVTRVQSAGHNGLSTILQTRSQ